MEREGGRQPSRIREWEVYREEIAGELNYKPT